MSAAPDWPSLLDFEAQFDTALPLLLAPYAAAPYSLQLCGDLGTADKTTPRLEYGFEVGEPTGPGGEVQQRAAAALAARPLAYKFTLRLLFVFDPAKVTAAQRALPGALRDLLAPPAPGAEGAFTAVRLPWLAITALGELRAARSTYADESEKSLAQWSGEWEGIFSLRETALPD